MKQVIIFIIILGCTTTLLAQDTTAVEEDDRWRIREIIEDEIYDHIKRELGITLKRRPTQSKKDDRLFKKIRFSLYAFPVGVGIPRNHSSKFAIENLEDKFLFRYNRVEGLFLGLQSPHKFHWEEERKFTLFGSIGYGFGEYRWRYNVGAAQQFTAKDNLLEVGVEGHSLTDTPDHWLIGNLENTLNSIFARYDYRDYLERKGFSTWLGWYIRKPIADLQFKLSFADDRYSSLSKNVNWSLFRTKRSYRDNPAIDEGRIRSIIFSFEMHRLNDDVSSLAGWNLSLSKEFAIKALKGDYAFNCYLLDFRWYQPLSQYDNLNTRFRIGTSDNGYLPAQRRFELGGVSTLPAFPYKQFQGNRLLLSNIEYIINGDWLTDNADSPLSFLLDDIGFIVFFDAGFVNSSSDNAALTSGFDKLKFNNIKSDWGFALGSRDGKDRLGFAWRTDVGAPVSIFFRMSRPF